MSQNPKQTSVQNYSCHWEAFEIWSM